MTNDEYKAARKQLALSVADWVKELGISIDTHKGYNSGRAIIQLPVVNHIKTLLELDRIKNSVLNTPK